MAKTPPSADPESKAKSVPGTGNDVVADNEIVYALNGYKEEAKDARQGGLNPRDDKWRENLDLYWNRFDFQDKADWQAKETLPEVPSFVDRFAAAMKEALVALPEGFYTMHDPADAEGDLTSAVKKMLDVWLGSCGHNLTGHVVGFPSVFESQIKLGSMMASCAMVTWKNDRGDGRVSIETVDPQQFWLDHTGRGLYRIRSMEIDRHELLGMAAANDSKGKPIYNLPSIEQLTSSLEADMRAARERLTGEGQEITTPRNPIVLDEYYATVINEAGKLVAEDSLMVVANDQFLIRGPEKNPFWHDKDWVVFSPLIETPMSVYGRSYMEDFGSVAKTLNELTNLILDAVMTSSTKVFAAVPEMLANPEQLTDGIQPFKIFELEEGVQAKDFMEAIDLGNLPSESIQVWLNLKNELREAAGMNEVGLGQFAPNSRTSATEVSLTQQSSNAIIRGVAQTVEQNFLNPVLDLAWKTGLQHVKRDDAIIRSAVGPEMFDAIYSQRKDLIQRPITIKAQGISRMLQKARELQTLIQIMSIVAQNEQLLAAFFQEVDMMKLIQRLFQLSDIDLSDYSLSEREAMMRAAAEPLQAAQARSANGSAPSDLARGEARQIAQTLGAAQ